MRKPAIGRKTIDNYILTFLVSSPPRITLEVDGGGPIRQSISHGKVVGSKIGNGPAFFANGHADGMVQRRVERCTQGRRTRKARGTGTGVLKGNAWFEWTVQSFAPPLVGRNQERFVSHGHVTHHKDLIDGGDAVNVIVDTFFQR